MRGRLALAGVIADLSRNGITGRFNFLLTDGEAISATAAGDTLCYRAAGPATQAWWWRPSPVTTSPDGPRCPATPPPASV